MNRLLVGTATDLLLSGPDGSTNLTPSLLTLPTFGCPIPLDDS